MADADWSSLETYQHVNKAKVDPEYTDLVSEILKEACRRGNIEDIKALIPEIANRKQNSVEKPLEEGLLLASKKGQLEAIRLLLEKGVSVNCQAGWTHYRDDSWAHWHTPLHMAAEAGQLEAAKLLVSKGADLNPLAFMDKETPLFRAVKENHADMVEFLVKSGASVDIRNHNDKTALDIAKARKYTNIIEILEKHVAGAK